MKKYIYDSPDYHRVILRHDVKLQCIGSKHDTGYDTIRGLQKEYICSCGKKWQEATWDRVFENNY